MNIPCPKQALSILISTAVALLILFCISCKKISNDETSDPPYVPTDTSKVTIRDLSAKINSSVSGFVTDELSNAVNGAAVMVGNLNSTTDKYGFFEIKNAQVVKEAAVITIVKPGYFKGIKTYIAKEGKSAFFRIQLIPKNAMGSIDAAAGGSITLSLGPALGISIPGNAVVNANTNDAYKGQINIAAKYINPEGNDMRLTMPGDLRGSDSLGSLKLLTTYGMAAVELTGSAGELLQLAAGKKATLTFPISNSQASNAPSTIPLWYFDEANGLWKQQGFAIKSGNNYVGEVSHFSFWNCDVPSSYVHFDCTVVDAKGNSIQNATVKISSVSDPSNAAWGYTDTSGYVAGAIPDNSQLLLEVFTSFNCFTPVVVKNFITTSADLSMGNIAIQAAPVNASVSGTVINCNGTPIADGYIIMYKGRELYRYAVGNSGTFNFNTSVCDGNQAVFIFAEDISGSQTGNPKAYTLSIGNNDLGNISSCADTNQFINYIVNGKNFNSLNSPVSIDVSYGGIDPNHNNTPFISILGTPIEAGTFSYISFRVDTTNIGLGTKQEVFNIFADQIQSNHDFYGPAVLATITEYGNPGEFISGNFEGVRTNWALTPPVFYNISCNFRVKRP